MWTHANYPGIQFDADITKGHTKPFRLEGYNNATKRVITKRYKSYHAAKKDGWSKVK